VAQQHASSTATATHWARMRLAEPLLRDPIWVYNDWSAYDELSDNIPLTEALAMKELGQIVRIRSAATPAAEKTQTPEEIHERNAAAFRHALKAFRQKNPDVVLVAFNGFGGDLESTAGPFPFHSPVDLRWLEVFDSLYSGDPRPSDVPEVNFWRSMDIYSDHMVRRYEQSFLPLERVDSSGFMIGNTGTIYYRKTNAWKGMLLLIVARGGWVNTIHGNLEFLDDENAKWFAKVQGIYASLQATGRTKSFRGIPGDVRPYGFGSLDSRGAIYTVVNPAQSVEEIAWTDGGGGLRALRFAGIRTWDSG
jgi:hypothetical protein